MVHEFAFLVAQPEDVVPTGDQGREESFVDVMTGAAEELDVNVWPHQVVHRVDGHRGPPLLHAVGILVGPDLVEQLLAV